ncbi:MAG: Nif3-like dinuclear metal center hexameric protein [Prevotella sp.]|nr:Nif3-like dinuclear metal center hexameric protein [Prevotella sp.]
MKIKQVLEALERFAPLPLQESWDNAGLQIGLTEAEVSGALLCLDVTEAIIDEAVSCGCNLVVSHHPLLFRGLKQVADLNDVQRTVRKAIKHDVCVVSMHTNLDNAAGGVNFKIAECLGLNDVHFGAGGQVLNGIAVEKGQWVMGTLPEPMAAQPFVAFVKERLEAQCALCNEMLQRPIRQVAICGGAGDFLLDEVEAHGADAFITGEMHYHQYFGHEQQLQIVVVGHYESEHFTAQLLRDIINDSCPGMRTQIAKTNTNPILYI